MNFYAEILCDCAENGLAIHSEFPNMRMRLVAKQRWTLYIMNFMSLFHNTDQNPKSDYIGQVS